jgi:hypothetical protein
MKCLNRIEMQECVDNEVKSSIENEILTHISNCEKCTSLYNEAIEDKAMINRLLEQAGSADETNAIPEFKLPARDKKKNISFRFVVILAAASLIGFIFLFRPARKPVTEKLPNAEMLIYEFYDGKDLNKLWHEKSQIIIIEDEKGNVIQSTITY